MRDFFRSFGYAFRGMVVSWREQRNLKVQSAVACLTVAAGFFFQITGTEWCLVLFSIALVMCMEMVNSAIEGLVDFISPEHNVRAGKIKDIAAGAVLFAAIIAVVIGVIVFRKYLL